MQDIVKTFEIKRLKAVFRVYIYIDCCIKTSWYMPFSVTVLNNTESRYTPKKKKQSKDNTKGSHQTSREENKRRDEKKTNKNKSKQLTK